jgi:hypothetical protein
MSVAAPDLLAPFADRPPGPGRAFVRKDRQGSRLALADARSTLLGVDEGKMCATFVISTDDPDRVDDVVTTKGIHLDNFKTNPIAFYGHQALILPIGKWADRDNDRCTIRLAEHRATGTCYFSQRSKQATDVFDLVVEGILRATSIGFNPMAEPVPRDGRKANPISLERGFVFPRVDLLEVSIVGIPAQPTATLVREYLAGAKGRRLDGPVRKSLQALAEAPPVWSQGADMSKKWGKTTSKRKPSVGNATTPASAPALPKALPPGVLGRLVALVAKDSALQECVSHKIPKLIDEGYSQDQAAAIAYSMCGEDGKALGGLDGAAGGYTVPPDGQTPDGTGKGGKAAAAAVAKAPEPPPQPGGVPSRAADGAPPDDDYDDTDEGPPEPGEGKANPKEVLGRLVDALTDYLDLTTQPAPTQAPPGLDDDDEEDDDDEDEDGDMDLDGTQQDDDDRAGLDRYQHHDARPGRTKAALCKACRAKLCKDCKAALAAKDDDAADAADEAEDPETGPPGQADVPVTKGDAGLDVLDDDAILAALARAQERAQGIDNAWAGLQGTLP